MRVVISKNHLRLNESLAKQSNLAAGKFSDKNYSKVENISSILLKRDISVEKKKNILLKKLHESIINAFSLDKNRFSKKTFDSLKNRLNNIRNLVSKLRNINFYLETTLLDDLKISRINIKEINPRIKEKGALAKNDLEILEYTAYKLIGNVITLDKKLLKGYSSGEKKIFEMEKSEMKDIGLILEKETEIMGHLEAKLPPPRAVSKDLIKEPTFSHWVARIFALLSYLEHLHESEKKNFSRLKANKIAKIKISRKISQIIKEKSKLLEILEEKAVSMETFNIDSKLKKGFQNLRAAVNV